MAHQIMQAFVEDHVSPFMKFLGDMRLKVGRVSDLPPMPAEPVTVVHCLGVGGPYIKMLPSADLMAWAAEVRARTEVGYVSVGGAIRREGVASRDGSVGYMEMPALTVDPRQAVIHGTTYRPQTSDEGIQR